MKFICKTDWSYSLKGALLGLVVVAIEIVNLVLFFSLDFHELENQHVHHHQDHIKAEYDIKLINTLINTTAVVACIVGFFHIRR